MTNRVQLVTGIAALCMTLSLGTVASAADTGSSFQQWLFETGTTVNDGQKPAPGPESKQCIDCHNGYRAVNITVKSAAEPIEFQRIMNTGRFVSTDHPVGMDYESFARRQPGKYRPASELNHAIKLENGKVTCISCHTLKEDRRNSAPGFIKVGLFDDQGNEDCTASGDLTITTGGSRLCLACHLM